MTVRVKRDGAEWEQTFSRGAPTSKLVRIRAARGSGTTVEFHPDRQIFPQIRFDPALIRERLEAKAYLHRGLTVVFHDQVGKASSGRTHGQKRSAARGRASGAAVNRTSYWFWTFSSVRRFCARPCGLSEPSGLVFGAIGRLSP